MFYFSLSCMMLNNVASPKVLCMTRVLKSQSTESDEEIKFAVKGG